LFTGNLSDPITSNINFQTYLSGPTASPYSGSSNLNLSGEALSIVNYVRRKFGEPVLPANLPNESIFISFEDATIKYSAIINTFQIRNWMSNMLGLKKDFSLNDLTGKLPMNQFSMLKRITEGIAGEIAPAVGGKNNIRKMHINLVGGQQDYIIPDDIVDSKTTSALRDYMNSISSQLSSDQIIIKEVFHFSPTTLYRFYDPYSSINMLSQEFSFESFNTETIFYVLPLWNDILRAQMLGLNDKVRRSNFSYERVGDRLRIMPTPKQGMKLFLDVAFGGTNPFAPFGSLSADQSITGISNLSNAPFTDIAYDKINSIGKNFIREYTFATCMTIEGRIRRKFKSIPIPNGDVTLDGAELVQEGFELQEKLEKTLRDDLEHLTNVSLMEQEAKILEFAKQQESNFPGFIYMF
jgi:hypothetical protein